MFLQVSKQSLVTCLATNSNSFRGRNGIMLRTTCTSSQGEETLPSPAIAAMPRDLLIEPEDVAPARHGNNHAWGDSGSSQIGQTIFLINHSSSRSRDPFKDIRVNSGKAGTDLKDNSPIPPYTDDHDCLGQTTATIRARWKNNFKYL